MAEGKKIGILASSSEFQAKQGATVIKNLPQLRWRGAAEKIRASPRRRSLRNLTPIKFLQINRWPYALVSMLAAELSRTISEPQISRDIPMATCKRTQHFIRLTACRWRLRTHIGDLGEFGHDLTPLAGVGMVTREEIDPTLTGGRIMEKALDEVEEKFLDARRVGDGISRKRVEAMTAAADTHGERGAVEDESDG